MPAGIKKAPLVNQKSLLFFVVEVKLVSDLSVTQIRVLELAPYLAAVNSGQVVKASKGHIPQPFLISDDKKNWCKDKREKRLRTKKNFDNILKPATGKLFAAAFIAGKFFLFRCRHHFLLLISMARIAGIQTINNLKTGEIERLVIDIDNALKNEQLSSIIEDLLDHMQIVKAKKTANLIPWEEAKVRINKKFGFE